MTDENRDEVTVPQSEVTIGQLLAEFDTSLLYLLERRYLDDWHQNLNRFQSGYSNLDWRDSFCGFKIEGLRYFREMNQELALQNMENFLGHYRDGSHSLICSIDGRGRKPPELLFMSSRRPGFDSASSSTKGEEISTKGYADLMNRSFKANFPGAQIQNVSAPDYSELAEWSEQASHVGILTGVPGRKEHSEQFFAQGIERFLDSVSGLNFSCLLVAEPYTVKDITEFLDPALKLRNEIDQLRNATLSDTWSKTKSEALTTTMGANLGGGKSDTTTKLGGGSLLGQGGGLAGVGTMALLGLKWGSLGGPGGMAIGALVGGVLGTAAAIVSGIPISSSHTSSINGGGFASLSRTTSESRMQGQTVTREVVNSAATHALGIVDEYIERLREARSYGLWNVGFYCFCNSAVDFVGVKNAATSVFSGERSGFEPLRFVDLKFGRVDTDGRSWEERGVARKRKEDVVSGIVAGFNPRLNWDAFEQHPLGKCFDGLSTPLNTRELAIITAPPQRECRSISVSERGAFGGALPKPLATPYQKGKFLELGRPEYFGSPQETPLSVPMDTLVRHAFVTGITGSGKTNTVLGWCHQLNQQGIPWMVIEPSTKREYRSLSGDESMDISVFSLGTEGTGEHDVRSGVGAPFRLNPFYFEEGTGLLTHVDAVKATFNAAFPMYASMPYILEEAILAIYADKGWRATDSTNRHSDSPWSEMQRRYLFPTLQDLLEKIDDVVENKRYDVRLQMDISAALRARIGSLVVGSKGCMLNTPISLSMNTLVKNNVVLEMGAIGNDEEKAFVMGLITQALCEHASNQSLSSNNNLRHVLIIEEAHRLLRDCGPADNPEIANTRGAAVEQFANMLAELRAFGQGIVVVDQVPSKLCRDVLKNTNLKIVHQLSAADDRRVVGDTMVLNDRQMDELARLEPSRGQAVVYQQNWENAYIFSTKEIKRLPVDYEILRNIRKKLLSAHPEIYGEVGELVGFTQGDISADERLAAARAMFGIALGNVSLLESGVEKLRSTKGFTGKVAANTGRLIVAQSAFEEIIDLLLRQAPARLAMLTECPEMYWRLIVELGSDDRKETLNRLRETLLQATGVEDGYERVLSAAGRYFVKHRGIQKLPLEIGTKEAGEGAYTTLKMRIDRELDSVCSDCKIAEHSRREVERVLVEQACMLAGFQAYEQIIDSYRQRFLA